MKKIVAFFISILLLNIFSVTAVNANASAEKPDDLLSGSAILMDAKSGQVLYEKDANISMYPASLTKVATAIYAIEKGNLDDVVTVSSRARAVDGTRVYLEEGEQVTLLKLIQGLLINSGNDAGVAIAEHMSGTVENFASDLNSYLKNKIGVQNTNFENPHGLFDPTHVTTAFDLAKITQHAMKNELFQDIIGTKKLEWNGQAWSTTLYSHHKLMREIPYEGVTGGKTGYVDESGYTLLTTAERENISLIVVTLKADVPMDGYNDTIKLLDYGFENFKTETITKGTEFKNKDGVNFLATEEISYTKNITDDVTKEVTDDGMLHIIQEDSLLDKSVQLTKEVEKVKVVSTNRSDSNLASSPASKASSPYIFWYIFLYLIILGLVLLAVRQWRSRA